MLNCCILIFYFLGAETNEDKSYIYISGGKNDEKTYENCVLKMDTNMGRWNHFKTMGARRSEHQSLLKGDQLYFIGGHNGSGYVESAKNEIVSLSDELAAKTFPFMHNKRLSFGMCSLAECVFVGGGYQNPSEALDKCEVYSFETREWTEVSSMNTKRSECTLTYFQGKIWAIGGFNDVDKWLDTIETFDITQNRWTTSNLRLLTERAGHGTVAYDKKLFVVGGGYEESIFSSVEVYSSETNQFSFVASMNIPRCNFGCCVVNSSLYAMGGSSLDYDAPTDEVEMYDVEENKWRRGPSLPLKLADFACSETL